MAEFDIGKYQAMFTQEAEELFETIDSILLEAEESATMDSESINSLFRCVHTLKGNSASVELLIFAGLAHELEFFMDKLRNGQLEFRPAMVESLFQGIDTLKEILEKELSGEIHKSYYDEISHTVLSQLKGFEDEVFVETDEEQGFGLIAPFDADGAFGAVGGRVELQDDGFGFFDDEPAVATATVQDDGFGFFDDEPAVATATVQDDGFGFFDDEPAVPSAQAKKISEQPAEQLSVKPQTAAQKKSENISNSIRVDLTKIDDLMNSIGELVIAHSMLSQYAFTVDNPKIKSDLSERLDLIDRHIRELQESVMSVRMVPMEAVFSKFPKMIRDTAKKIDKKVLFQHIGESVEIDKAMIEGITDPLMHIVRNAIDHGIETPEMRIKAGKNESGTLVMSAEQTNGQIMIKIQDDGAGINLPRVVQKAIQNGLIDENQAALLGKNEQAMLIFAPGLSTAEAVTDISGRGVGMDVVMSNIKLLGGSINIDTEEGYGSTFTIALPLTLAILDGLTIRIGKEQFILPLSVIIESLNPTDEMIKQVGDNSSEILMLRNEFIPVVRLHSIFNVEPQSYKLSDGLLIVVRSASQKIAIFVDEFMNQQQFVIKPLDKNFRNAKGIGGATVRGDGTIGLIIDTMNIMEKH